MLNRALVSIGEAPISAAAPAAAASSDSSDSDSDSSDSDSDSNSSSSSSSSESEAGGKKKRPRAMMSDDESDDEAGRSGPRDPFAGPTTANEAIEPPPEPLPFEKVAEHVELRPLGHILSIVDSVVIVAQDVARKQPGSEAHQQQQARPRPRDQAGREGEGEGEYSVLDSGSTLAFEDRTVLGVVSAGRPRRAPRLADSIRQVYETFGSVLAPLYSLRFKSADDVQRVGVTIGRAVLYDPASSVYVLTRQLRQEKGSDASNLHDEEVDAHERDFSDDEAEAAARAARKKGGAAGKKRAEKRKGNEGDGGYQQRGNGRTGGLPSRPDFDAPLSNGNAGGPSRAEGRAMPLPYDEPSAWTPAPSTSAVSALPLRVAAGLSAQSERAASQGSSNGVAKAGLPLSRPAGLPAKPQVSWDSAEPAGSSSSATASPALAQAQPAQPPPIFLTGEAPPPGAHINPLFAHQWQQQAQSTGAYQYAAPHAQQQPYYAQPQQRWPGAQPQQQQWSQNYGQYGQHAAMPPQQQQQAWGWNAAQQQQQQQPQAQGQQQQDYAAYDPQQPGTQWSAAAWGQPQGSPPQPRPPQ
jgi:H/ACA ribonucleoprotein complex non-core subunit NAF1